MYESTLTILLFGLTLVGCVYTGAAIVCLWRYARQTDRMPVSHPSLTVLRPLHGDEPCLFETLSSFMEQDYAGPVAYVFGVADRHDPAIATVERLRKAYPDADMQLVIDPRRNGRNGKISNLVNMTPAINGEIVVLADSDMLVGPDYLTRVIGALEADGVGAVTCLYRGVSLPNIWSRFATGWIDEQFLPNVILGMTLGLTKPCFGSTIALRTETLWRIGGFSAFTDQLADDYAIGTAVRRLGLTVAVPARPVLGHISASTTAEALLAQELRWNRTIKSIDFGGFVGSVVTHMLPFALLTALADGFEARDGLLIAAVLGLRAALHHQVKTFVQKDAMDLWLMPLRDLLSFAVFLGAFIPGLIEWRGRRHGLRADGTLTSPDTTTG